MWNQVKTVLLLGALTGLMMVVGGLIGGYDGLLIGLVFALTMNLLTFWFSDKLVLWMYGAKEVSKSQAPRLHRITESAAKALGIPKPKVYIIQSSTPNAFATGRSPGRAAVAATDGILKLLDDDELLGVMAHECSHVKNRDILVATIAACIAGVISYLAAMARWGSFSSDDDGPNPLALIVIGILTPILAMMLQLAISRSREYFADETGARAIKNPSALASALKKLHHGVKSAPWRGNSTAASLFIVNPFSLSLFSTHPPMDERVRRLESLQL
ncbi:zinc metalloprotease HtpX [Candidatus Woesearchaeota archaeon]|nr:zinc metalloprotease HtpX [Candidatus Woesearchaeota archaeon]